MQYTIALILSPIAGVFVTTILWLVINSFAGDKILEQAPWPISNIYLCAAIGGGLALARAAIIWFSHRQRREGVAQLAAPLGLEFSQDVSRGAVSDYDRLTLFSNWSRARNRLAGEFDGVAVDMFDYTACHRGSGHAGGNRSGNRNHYDPQTVVVIPLKGKPSPAFEVRPRSLLTSMLGVFGIQRLKFQVPEDRFGRTMEQETVEQFDRQYFVSRGIGRALAKLAGDTSFEPEHEEEETGSIASRFSIETIRKFVQHPNWCVESSGTHVVLWHHKKLIRASERRAFLQEAIDLYRAIESSKSAPLEASFDVIESATSRATMFSNLAGVAVGGFAGFFLGAAITMPIVFLLMKDDGPGWVVILFPFSVMACAIAGAVTGHKLTQRFVRH